MTLSILEIYPEYHFQIGTFLFFASGVIMFFFTLMRLKRVEMDEHFIYVTNYFKNYRYPYHNIEKIEESKFLFLTLVSVCFVAPGNFGKKITFIASNSRYKAFWKKYPERKEQLVEEF